MKPISRRVYAVSIVLLAIVTFLAINIAAEAGLTHERLDLTASGRFTLSDGTKNIIRNLQEPITFKFYYSRKIAADYAQIDTYSRHVRDLLEEYASRSNGKIILQEIDTEPFTPEEDEASASGLTAAPTEGGDQVYFGLVATNTIDGKEVIPFFTQEREPYLEYDLTSLVYHLSTLHRPKLAIVTSLPLASGAGGIQAAMQGQAQPFVIYAQLQQAYAMQQLDPAFSTIPSDVDVVLIAHPPALNPQQLFAIDQFVLRGGRALVFVDPDSEINAASAGGPMGESGGLLSSSLPGPLSAWGISYDPRKVLADKSLAQSVETSTDPRNPVTRYPVWLHLTTADFDPQDQVTANLQTLNLASAGALFPTKGATTEFTPLVHSSNQAALLDLPQVRLVTRPQDLMDEVHPTGQTYTIAARITGPANTAFPHGDPQSPHAPFLKKSSGPINVIVMADSDIFDDKFWVRVSDLYGHAMAQPFADNSAFVLNSVENLTGSSDMISLRTRATTDRQFTVVKDLQAKAQAQFQQEADALQAKMTDTEQRLHALEQGQNQGRAGSLSPAQNEEVNRFKQDLMQTRAQLRDVQANLRKDIDALGTILAFINIALVPILVALFAIVLAVIRRRRRLRGVAMQ